MEPTGGRRRAFLTSKQNSFARRKEGKLISVGKSNLVFVRDETFSWLPARVISTGHLCATIVIDLPPDWKMKTCVTQGSKDLYVNNEEREINLRDYPGNELPLQNSMDDFEINNSDEYTSGKADMTDLYFLHDAAVLYNLRDRHFGGFPYTRVGDIMIAVNPYQWIDGLYSKKLQMFYANKIIWEPAGKDDEGSDQIEENTIGKTTNLQNYKPLSFPPHIYETASLAYKGLIIDGDDQTILVSGESGAGKTETVKLVMSYLATLQSTDPDFEHSKSKTINGGNVSLPSKEVHSAKQKIVNNILLSNPVFEAFGNAKTIRNSNSSRFGKFTKLKFRLNDNQCQLIGSEFQTYLLEKSRVINHDAGERLYHIFYQLMGAPEEDKSTIWEGLKNNTTSSFRYFGKSTLEVIDGVSDTENWSTTVNALSAIGIFGDEFLSLMRALCLILQFGNLSFAPDPAAPETSTIITNTDELQKVSDLMGVPMDVVTESLTQRNVKASWEEIHFSLSSEDAKDGCDALAKEIYSLMFDYLVQVIDTATSDENESLTSMYDDTGVISLLDIFGFECFITNRFEQLCINYANERLQQKYISDVFHEIQTEYEEEGIEIFDFSTIDNKNVVNLIEGKLGLLTILNEECVLPKGNDCSFVFKINTVNKQSDPLIKNKLFAPYEFAVTHFSGHVKYDARKFVERNKDALPLDLINVALKSSNNLIASLFAKREKRATEIQRSKPKKRKGSTVVSKFKTQLNELMNDINDSRTRYIRCIKPNSEKAPRVTDNMMTMNQLNSAGVVAAITIWRETYPKHLLYDQVLDRFQCLSLIKLDRSLDDKTNASKLLSVLFEGKYRVSGGQIFLPYACGKTKAFFRSGSLELLEASRIKLLTESAVLIQSMVRGKLGRNRYIRLRRAIISLQNYFRVRKARRKYIMIRIYIIKIQSSVRMTFAMKLLMEMRMQKAAITLQTWWRTRSNQIKFEMVKTAINRIQKFVRVRNDRKKLIEALALLLIQARKDDENTVAESGKNDDIREEADKMSQYYHNQLHFLRSEVTDLRSALDNERQVNRELMFHNENLHAYSDASRVEISHLREANKIQREDNAKLRAMIKDIQQTHLMQIRHHHELLVLRENQKQEERKALQKDLAELKTMHESEVIYMKKQLRIAKKSHRADVATLKKEMCRILNEHKNDLAQMFQALERAKSSDNFIRSIDEYTKSSYDQKMEDLKQDAEFYEGLNL